MEAKIQAKTAELDAWGSYLWVPVVGEVEGRRTSLSTADFRSAMPRLRHQEGRHEALAKLWGRRSEVEVRINIRVVGSLEE